MGAPACAIVHQYDRHALPIMVADVRFRGQATDFLFCQEQQADDGRVSIASSGEVVAADAAPSSCPSYRQCWTHAALQRGEPPIDRPYEPEATPTSASKAAASTPPLTPMAASTTASATPVPGPLSLLPHVIYINLNHRQDRRVSMEVALAAAGWPADRVHRLTATRNATHGHVGCIDSHHRAVQAAIAAGWPSVLVLEDDFVFRQPATAATRVAEFLAWAADAGDDWSVVLASGIRRDLEPQQRVACPMRKRGRREGGGGIRGEGDDGDDGDLLVMSMNSGVGGGVGYSSGGVAAALARHRWAEVHEGEDGCSATSPPPPPLRYAVNYQTTAGYLLSAAYLPVAAAAWADAADSISAAPERHAWFSLDQYWKVLQGPHGWYRFDPLLGDQAASFSDITHALADYTSVGSMGVWEEVRRRLEAGENPSFSFAADKQDYGEVGGGEGGV